MSDVAMAAVQAYLKELRLPAFARLLPETLREAESQGRPFLDVLRVLLEGELAQRQINQGRRRIREARFPYAKDLAEFDFTANPTIKKPQILSLARGEYLAKRQNVIFLGNSGTGKTHLAIALLSGLLRDWAARLTYLEVQCTMLLGKGAVEAPVAGECHGD